MDTQTQDAQTHTLPSGKTATIQGFKGKHIREAMRVGEGDTGKYLFALIASVTLIDGNPIVMEDLDDMDGKDAMKLQTLFTEANF